MIRILCINVVASTSEGPRIQTTGIEGHAPHARFRDTRLGGNGVGFHDDRPSCVIVVALVVGGVGDGDGVGMTADLGVTPVVGGVRRHPCLPRCRRP